MSRDTAVALYRALSRQARSLEAAHKADVIGLQGDVVLRVRKPLRKLEAVGQTEWPRKGALSWNA